MKVVLTFLLCCAALAQQHDVSPIDIEEGARYFGNFCAQCHGAEGNAMPQADLSRPNLRRATTDDLLASIMVSGIPGTAMPPNALRPREVFTIVAYIGSLRTAPPGVASRGNAARGQALFSGKGNCLSCHRVGDKGAFVGPNLSEIGLLRRAAALERSVVNPAAEILSTNATVVAVSDSGTTIRGRVLNEDTHSVQLMDQNGRFQSFAKNALRSLTRETTTAMPSYKDRLTVAELVDLVAYLTTLRGL